METTTSYESGKLTIGIKGRVDGSEAVKLQEQLNNYVSEHDDIEEIVIDAAELTYISSMGLRALLQLKKHEDNLSIINVCNDVYNVFQMTGFVRIFNVEKALPQMDVEGLPQVKGLNDFYQVTDETMVKVFPESATKEDFENETNMAKAVFVLGIPTAMAMDKVMVGKRFGLIYESINPQEIGPRELGDFVRTLHEQIVEPDEVFHSNVAKEKAEIKRLEPYLGEDAVAKLLQMLSAVPDGSSLLHGNLSPNTVVLNAGEPMMVDMYEVGYGNPVLDLAHLYSSLNDEQRGEYFESFLRSYYDLESAETLARNRQNIITLSLIRDYTSMVLHGTPSAEVVEQKRQEFETNVAGRWEEILSHLKFKMDFNEEIRKLERRRFYLDSDVDIDWIASTLGTNRHYVSDYFNKVLHTTFNDYINTLRLDYAVKLIRAGQTSPSQIAYAAGFNNDHTFRRLFKQRFGCTPSQFEK